MDSLSVLTRGLSRDPPVEAIMRNVTVKERLSSTSTGNLNQCSYLHPRNSTFLANWENIPETVLLNGSIGIILFITFTTMTKIAWRRSQNDDPLSSQNIITFLYGYREPDYWHVIPRYEFLPHKDRHHSHDLQYPNIYIPPKLPLANPIEMFAFDIDMEKTKSLDSSTRQLERKRQQLADNSRSQRDKKLHTKDREPVADSETNGLKTLSQTTKDGQAEASTSKSINSATVTKSDQSESTIRSKITSQSHRMSKSELTARKSSLTRGLDVRKLESDMMNQSFFYPSILTAEQTEASYLSRKLNRFFSMFFKVTDADMIYAKGVDAYEYLLFQRHLILIMFVTNILCLGFILPVHWLTGSDTDFIFTTSFQRSTIKNLNPQNKFYWAHIICTPIIVVCSIIILNSYRDSIITRNDPRASRRTLLIGNISPGQRKRAKLLSVMQEYFPRSTVEAIQFVYDTNRLAELEQDLSSVMVAKEYCSTYRQLHQGRELLVHSTDINTERVCNGNCRLCSFILVCCCYWPREGAKQPGTSYYAKQELLSREKIKRVCEEMVEKPTEYAFVTFKSHKQARRVLQDLAHLKRELLDERYANSLVSRPKLRSKSVDSLDSGGGGVGGIGGGGSVKTASREPGAEPKQADDWDSNVDRIKSIRTPPPQFSKRLNDKAKRKDTNEDAPAAKTETRAPGSEHANERRLELGPIRWSARFAPHPDNVGFRDLLLLARASKLTIAALHLLMIIIFIFITTPNVILSMFERLSVIQPDKVKQLTGFQAMIINYFTILLQISTTALLPNLVTQISKQIPYEDTSSKDHSVMWKVYLFLVLMILIMPSIGMTSAQAIFETDIDPECLFPTDNGAFFINYVISSIFLSTMLELIKPVDILSYYFILWTSRSTAELEGGRQFIEKEFSVALQHTSVLLIFTVVMTYAISCPLIAPVGLIYLIVKHSVDHYHLYYTYFTKKVDRELQQTVMVLVKVALLLMLFQTTVAISLNTGTSYFALISQIVFCITLAAFVFNCFFDCTTRVLPQPQMRRNKFNHEFCACYYLPQVFGKLLKLEAIPPNCISRQI